MAKGRGGGKTPEMVTALLKKKVEDTSQSAVARESGLTLLTVQRYLKGIGEPTTATLEKLANYFGVSAWFLRGEHQRVNNIEQDIVDAMRTLKIAHNISDENHGDNIIDRYNLLINKLKDIYGDNPLFLATKSLLDKKISLLESEKKHL